MTIVRRDVRGAGDVRDWTDCGHASEPWTRDCLSALWVPL